MAYDSRQPASILVGTLAAETLTSTGVFGYNHILLEDCSISRLMLKITTAVVSPDNAMVVTFYARPLYGNASGQTTLGAVTVPVSGGTLNAVYYKDIDPVNVAAGTQIVADVTAAATGSGAAGAAFAGFLAQYSPEDPANMSALIAG